MVGAGRVSNTLTVTFQCARVTQTKDVGHEKRTVWRRQGPTLSLPLLANRLPPDVELTSKKIERARGEGGGRQRYRYVDGDVSMCVRNKTKWNEIKRNRKEQQQQSKKRMWQQKDEKCRKWKQRYKQQHWSKRDNKWDKKVKICYCHRATDHTHTQRWERERLKAGWSKGWWNKISQHSPQCTENACKASYLHDTEWYIETVGPHIGGQEECLLQQGCQSKRHDPHGKRPQMCYGNIRDKCAKVAITTSKKEVSQKRTSPRRNLKTAESIKSHDDANARSVKRTDLKSATLNSKEQSSMTPEAAAIAQKLKTIRSSTMLEHAEGVVDAEVAAAHQWHDDTNAAVVVKRSGRFVAKPLLRKPNQHTIRMMTQTQQPSSSMGDLLRKPQQHSIIASWSHWNYELVTYTLADWVCLFSAALKTFKIWKQQWTPREKVATKTWGMKLPEFTQDKVQAATGSFRKGKARDYNGIRAEDIKTRDETTKEMIRQIFNGVLKQEDCTQETWRIIRIKVIQKREMWKTFGNNRPARFALSQHFLQTLLNNHFQQILQKTWPCEIRRPGWVWMFLLDHLTTYRFFGTNVLSGGGQYVFRDSGIYEGIWLENTPFLMARFRKMLCRITIHQLVEDAIRGTERDSLGTQRKRHVRDNEGNETGWSFVQLALQHGAPNDIWKCCGMLAKTKGMGIRLGVSLSDCFTNKCFADDVLLFSVSLVQLQKMMCDFKQSTESGGLDIDPVKTNISQQTKYKQK